MLVFFFRRYVLYIFYFKAGVLHGPYILIYDIRFFFFYIYIAFLFLFFFCLVKERGKKRREREESPILMSFFLDQYCLLPSAISGWPESTFSQTTNHSISLFTGASCHLPITREYNFPKTNIKRTTQ